MTSERNEPARRECNNQGVKHPVKLLDLVIPREHGSWAVLIISAALPRLIIAPHWREPWFVLAVTALFFARGPIEYVALGKNRSRPTTNWELWPKALGLAIGLSVIGVVFGLLGLLRAPHPQTIALAVAAGAWTALGLYLESVKRSGSFFARSAAIFGLLLLIPLQESALFGQASSTGWGLLLLSFAFFTGSALRVRSLVRARRYGWFRKVVLIGHGAALAVAIFAAMIGYVPTLSPLALAPSAWQAWRLQRRGENRVDIRRMGIGEILHAVAFTATIWAVYAYSV